MTFEDLSLIEPLVRAVRAEGYTEPTPIQARGIPEVMAGKDLCGVAQTGTGKTAAFALPILQRLAARGVPATGRRPIRVMVLSPTRELAAQIGESFATYGRHLELRHTVIFGGVGQDAQNRALRSGIDILVATPGRLLDLMGQGLVKLEQLEVFVLDEADRMLDMGFIHDVRRVIAALPRRRQTLFFSATMPEEIEELSRSILTDPVRIEVTPSATTVETVEQRLFFVEKKEKRGLLEWLLEDPGITRALVFTRTKHGANRVVEHLVKGDVRAEAIHGNKSQNARERALGNFKKGTTRVLVATDIAARGIDIDGISHVINYDLPNVPESYVHRIGRTARAGAAGVALSFCEVPEREFLIDIERLIRQHLQRVDEHPFRSPYAPPPATSLHRGAAERRQEPPRPRSDRGPRAPMNRRPPPRSPTPRSPTAARPSGSPAARPAGDGPARNARPRRRW